MNGRAARARGQAGAPGGALPLQVRGQPAFPLAGLGGRQFLRLLQPGDLPLQPALPHPEKDAGRGGQQPGRRQQRPAPQTPPPRETGEDPGGGHGAGSVRGRGVAQRLPEVLSPVHLLAAGGALDQMLLDAGLLLVRELAGQVAVERAGVRRWIPWIVSSG